MSLWVAIALVAVTLGLLVLIRWLLHPAPGPVLGERGILEPASGWGWIPWDEVEGAYPPTVEETETVRVRVRVTDRLARILKRRRGGSADVPLGEAVVLRLDLSGTDVSAVEALREIMARSRAGSSER